MQKILRSARRGNLVVAPLVLAMLVGGNTTMTPKTAKPPRKEPQIEEEQVIWGHDAILAIYPLIRAFLIGRLGWQMGEEVAHDAMVAILKKLGSVRARTFPQFRAFCYAIARHKFYDALRSKDGNRAEPLDPAELVNIIEAGAGADELSPGRRSDLDYLLALLRASKPPCDEMLWENIILGLEPEELAMVYGGSADAARMKLRRCWDAAKTIAEKHG